MNSAPETDSMQMTITVIAVAFRGVNNPNPANRTAYQTPSTISRGGGIERSSLTTSF